MPTQDRYSSLEFDAYVADVDTADPPEPAEIWRTQLSYWIQKDVVAAIVALNEEAASRIKQEGGAGWVGNMPVKDLLSIRLTDGFIYSSDDMFYGHAAEGPAPALPPGTPATVFTQSSCGDAFDVIQFTVKVVMDQRDISLLVERLCNNRFHTLLRVAYMAVPPNRNMKGKIYGSEPTVLAVMDFETILLGEVFRRWMPQEVREDPDYEEYRIVCREIDECAYPEE